MGNRIRTTRAVDVGRRSCLVIVSTVWIFVASAHVAIASTQVDADPAIQREANVRRWAFRPTDHRPELETALASPDWQVRESALDALRRTSRDLPEDWIEVVIARTADPQANVRAAAIQVLSAHPFQWSHQEGGEFFFGFSEPGAQALTAQAGLRRINAWSLDPAPDVRLATVNALRALCSVFDLSHSVRMTLAGRLSVLANDEDPEVAEAALEALSLAGSVGAHALAVTLTSRVTLNRDAWSTVSPLLVRAPDRGPLADEIRKRLDPSGRSQVTGYLESLALEERRAGLTTACDVEVLAEAWFQHFDEPGSHVRDERLRIARLGDADLGRALQARLPFLDDPDRRAFLVQCMVEALPPFEGARALEPLSEGLAEAGWRTLGLRDVLWTADVLRPWISSDRGAGLRLRAASLASDALEHGPNAELEALLLELIGDTDPSLRIAAFHWLARAPHVASLAPELYAGWKQLDLEAGLERLRELPRATALVPFREDLMRLCAQGRDETSIFELLGGFQDDAEVFVLLNQTLQTTLQELGDEDSDALYHDVEARARHLVRALVRVDQEAAVLPLLAALEAQEAAPPPETDFGTRRWRLAKSSLAGLVRTETGRRAADDRLRDPSVERRIRIEAALLRASASSEARAYLRDELDHLDSVLAERALREFEHGDDDWIDPLLDSIARFEFEGSLPDELATLAIEMLGERGRVGALAALAGEPELAHDLFWALLGQIERGTQLADSESLQRALAERFEGELRRGRRERAVAVLAALARVGPLPPAAIEHAFDGPREAAAADLRQRFQGERGPDVQSRWRSELRLAEVLTERDGLREVLFARGDRMDPWMWDARLLAAFSRRAAGTTLAADLGDAARIGLMGEGPTPDRVAETTALELAVPLDENGEPDLARWLKTVDRLALAARVRGPRDVSRWLEFSDPRSSMDPWARLEALRHQIRAHLALDAGDVDLAQQALDRGHGPAQRSRSAQAEQDRIQGVIDAAR